MIVVGSANPGKVEPVREVFARLWPDQSVVGVSVPSGVRAQPLGFAETRAGALNRARAALAHGGAGAGPSYVPSYGSAWGVGLEGGVEFDGDGVGWLFGVVAVVRTGHESLTRSAALELPPLVAARVREGEELGPVMDDLSGVPGGKFAGGAVGFLTGGLLVRPDVWRQTLALALASHLNPELYGSRPLGTLPL